MASATITSGFNFNEIRTKSIERTIAPLISQVTTLTASPDGKITGKTPGKGKNGDVLLGALEKSIEHFIQNASGIIRDNPDGAEELQLALDLVRKFGTEMVNESRVFLLDASNSQKRTSMVSAARQLLSAVVRMLILADMLDVRLLICNVHKVKGNLNSLKDCQNCQELSERYEKMLAEMSTLSEETRKRLHDLKNPIEKDDLRAVRATLNTHTPILYSASKAFVRHPEMDPARSNRDYAHSQMGKALQAMDDIMNGKSPHPDMGLSQYEKVGGLIADLDKFQNTVYIDAYRDAKHRPELEDMLEKIVSGSAHIADSENTREDRKQRIVAECNALRQALQDLLGEYERNSGSGGEPSEQLDLSLAHLGRSSRDLQRHLRRAVVDHVCDAFRDAQTPLQALVQAADRGDERRLLQAVWLFDEHAHKIVKVANLVCMMSHNEDGVKMVKYAAVQVDRLAPQVVNAARLLCARNDSKEAGDNMTAFKEAWQEKVRLLTLAVDSVVTVDDFLAVSEAHIVEDVKACIQAVVDKNGDILDGTAGDIRARSLRVCSVVDIEMDMIHKSPYTQQVKNAVRVLRNDALPQFTNKAGEAVENLSQDPPCDVDLDDFIDSSSLVHQAIRDIRHALLLNRNPEDIDSDNEYIDDAQTEIAKNQVSEGENQQKIMRNLPEPEKKKIQEQIDVFKIVQTKFEKEVAKWDETGNDIIVLAKHMCMIMMNMTDFTRGRGPLKTTMSVIRSAQEISDVGAKLNHLAKHIGNESAESETRKDLVAYLQRITLYCQQLNITSRVKADVQQVGDELIVSGLESTMSLIQTSRNLLNAVVLTVKAAYIASTKYYRRKNNTAPKLVEWNMAPPQKQPLVRPQTNQPRGQAIIRRASDRRPMPPIKMLAQFNVAT